MSEQGSLTPLGGWPTAPQTPRPMTAVMERSGIICSVVSVRPVAAGGGRPSFGPVSLIKEPRWISTFAATPRC